MSYYCRLSRLFSFELSSHKEYLAEIERFLESEKMAQRAIYGADPDPLDEAWDDRLPMLEHFYPDILRKSLFVALYSLAETELKTICRHVKKRDKLPFSLGDIRGRLPKKVRKYLKLARVGFPDTPECVSFPDTLEWTEMEDYRKLRNCVVHNQGKLTSSNDDNRLRDTYIPSQHPHLSVYHSGNYDQVVFHKGFCEKAIKTLDVCMYQLCAALDSRPSRGATDP